MKYMTHSWLTPVRRMFRPIRTLLRMSGFDVVPFSAKEQVPGDLSAEDAAILALCRPHTLTSFHRLATMVDAISYIVHEHVDGSIVECGVWQGGSMMAAALKLRALGDVGRTLFLYDTFKGMPPPTEHDMNYANVQASDLLVAETRGKGVWAEASLDLVRNNMASTAYPLSNVQFIAGRVEDTLRAVVPDAISVLRLDTDWYESTRLELKVLYPKLVPGGILIIDDYGHWKGAKKAVDEYFGKSGNRPFFSRIDYTCRLLVKVKD